MHLVLIDKPNLFGIGLVLRSPRAAAATKIVPFVFKFACVLCTVSNVQCAHECYDDQTRIDHRVRHTSIYKYCMCLSYTRSACMSWYSITAYGMFVSNEYVALLPILYVPTVHPAYTYNICPSVSKNNKTK